MRLVLFDTRAYDRDAFEAANAAFQHDITYLEPRLTSRTAPLAAGFPAVCSFVNDRVDAGALAALRDGGTRLLALRSAGYNHVDVTAAARAGIAVVRVPEYSPHAVAEHAVCLMLALNRKVHRAYNRVREWNFALEGLVGFDVRGKCFGIVGTGRIGRAVARIAHGFGCDLLATDQAPDEALVRDLGVRYVEPPELYRRSDIISLHVPLTPATRHLLDAAAFDLMKPGVVVINTSRGALVDSRALIDALKRGRVGAAGLDVYEEEESVFFRNLSDQVIQDDVLARLLTFPNVLITSHQGFLTHEALAAIAETTLASVRAFERGEPLVNAVA